MADPPLRAFIAIQPPSEIRQLAEATQRELRSTIRPGLVRWTPVEQIHLTLRFLGDIPAGAVPELQSALSHACAASSATLELSLLGLGLFPDAKRPRVIWIGLGGALEALRQLQEAIVVQTARWGEREERPWHPHLTLGRIKAMRGLADLAPTIDALASKLSPGSWRVTQVDLMRSELSQEGARHSCLATIAIG